MPWRGGAGKVRALRTRGGVPTQEYAAAVADDVLLLRRKLGRGLADLIDEKQGVVAESVAAPGGVNDSPLNGIPRGQHDVPLRV